MGLVSLALLVEAPLEVELRPITPEDLPKVHGVIRRSEVKDNEPLVTPLDEVVSEYEAPFFDPAADSRLAVNGQGQVVAWAKIWYRPSTEREHRAYLAGGVDPDWRRRGIGSAIFAWQLQRGREVVAAAEPDLPRAVRTTCWDWLEDAIALYERFGLEPVRYNDVLSRSLAEPIPPTATEGFQLVPWAEAQSEVVRQAHNEAFADHWGSTPIPLESWEHMATLSDFRPDLSFLAVADGEVMGYTRNAVYPEDWETIGRKEGWVEQLGVRPSWRRRGVASALLSASMQAFLEEGLDHAALAVDTDNPTGAYGLYRRLGFRQKHRSVTHQLTVVR